jgi:hypothetical protein
VKLVGLEVTAHRLDESQCLTDRFRVEKIEFRDLVIREKKNRREKIQSVTLVIYP